MLSLFHTPALLTWVLAWPALGGLLTLLGHTLRPYKVLAVQLGLFCSFLSFAGALLLVAAFSNSNSDIGFYTLIGRTISDWLGLYISLGIDGLSLTFIVLTTFIVPVVIYSINTHNQEQAAPALVCLVLAVEFFLLLAFASVDLLFFFIAFESVLIPMYFIIIIWGSRSYRIRAGYYFFLYTAGLSLFLLFAILAISSSLGSSHYADLLGGFLGFSAKEERFIWFCIFVGLAGKVPMIPFHIWLPEAHAEAPASGSILLASLLLKLGGYGFIRFLIPVFPLSTVYFYPLVITMAVLSVSYAAFAASRQIDLKRVIAYSSISHMNLAILGLFSGTREGVLGGIILMVAHAFSSGGLFLLAGCLYIRTKSRLLPYFGGLAGIMPVFGAGFLSFSILNIGFPPTLNFVGEISCLLASYALGTSILFLLFPGYVLTAFYSMWLFIRICFGLPQEQYVHEVLRRADLSNREIVCVLLFLLPPILLGLRPTFIYSLLSDCAYWL